MTGLGATTPAIDQALLPADVRTGSKERKEQYSQALQFEKVLVDQLTEQLMKTSSSPSGEESAAIKAMKENMPSVLSDALIGAGGLGIAKQLDAQWTAQAGTTTASSLSATLAANAKGASGAASAGAPANATTETTAATGQGGVSA